jgi:hypothetical protein
MSNGGGDVGLVVMVVVVVVVIDVMGDDVAFPVHLGPRCRGLILVP